MEAEGATCEIVAPQIGGAKLSDGSLQEAKQKIDDGWETASPENVGMESASVNALIALIKGGSYKNIHSMLVVKDGKLVEDDKEAHAFLEDQLHTPVVGKQPIWRRLGVI